MKEELLARLDALAAKLGVTAQHLWGVLTRQAFVEGIQLVIWVLVDLLAAFAFGLMLRRLLAKGPEGCWHEYSTKQQPEEWSHRQVSLMWTYSVVLFVLVLFSVCGVNAAIGLFANPEYRAFTEIRQMLGR